MSEMADEKIAPFGQRLRRCFSDKSLSIVFDEQIKALKIPRRQTSNKENIPIVLGTVVGHRMALPLRQTEDKPPERTSLSKDDSGDDKLMLQELNFDKNNNNGDRYDSSEQGLHRHSTPPPSPTWNLKMLCEAVSPEIRRMQQEKELNLEDGGRSSSESSTHPAFSPSEENSRDGMDSSLTISQEVSTSIDMDAFTSRKEKSLGKLCDKFLSKYPEFPGSIKHEICLDEVAKELAVERRRIYDIVNVLESVEIVSRVAKNRYMWHGKTNLRHTLVKLKMLAKQDKIAEQMRRILDQEMEGVVSSTCSAVEEDEKTDCSNEESTQTVLQRKDRSLGIMSQKFLMLFLVSEPKTVNLELSARLLIDDPSVQHLWTPKFKTKIRRLYDIANILTSLRLIQKVHVTEFRGRKPAFKYTGPDVDDVEDIDSCCADGCHRPSSRHSLLDCIRNDSFVQSMSNAGFKPIHPAGPEFDSTKAELKTKLQRHMSEGSVSKMSRHPSSDELFRVVEKERNRLFSSSQPSSPIKKLSFEGAAERKEHKFVVPSLTKHLSFDDHTKQGLCKHIRPIPGKIIHRPKAVQAQAKPKSIVYCTPSPGSKPAETIIVTKDGEVKCMGRPSRIVATPGSSQTLSKSQLDQILQLKQSTPKSSARREIQFNKPMDGFTSIGKSLLQSPDHEMAIINETSPMPGTTFVKRTLKRNMIDISEPETSDKRSKIELPTPPCGSTLSDSLIVTEESLPSVSGSASKITTLRRIKSSPLPASLPHFVIRQVNKAPAIKGATQIRVHITPGDKSSSILTPPVTNAGLVENDSHVALTPGTQFQPIRGEGCSSPSDPIPVRIIENQLPSSLLLNSKNGKLLWKLID